MTELSEQPIKLAEALALRAAVQREQNDLERKIKTNLVFKENETPEENAAALVETYMTTSIQLRELIVAINATNIATSLDGGTITSAIAERDRLSSVIAMLEHTKAHLPSSSQHRKSQQDEKVKDIVVFDTKSMNKEIHRLQKLRKEVDMKLQLANWETLLILEKDSPAWELISATRELEKSSALRSVFDKQSGIRALFSRKPHWG